MTGLIVIVIVLFLGPTAIVMMNKMRVKGKMACVVVKDDDSVDIKLCRLVRQFVLYGDYGYDVYPKRVRVMRYPTGWPSMFQELVPVCLYNEKDAVPLDWKTLDDRHISSMKLKSSLDENFFRTLIETQKEVSGGGKFNIRKMLPYALLAIGVLALIGILMFGGCGGGG